MELPYSPRRSSTTRSSNGCWTCRLRRKKCDEKHPLCDTCAVLHITCHYDADKPEWMDGGVKQEEMAERLKREVKEKAHRRRGERPVHIAGNGVPLADVSTREMVLPHRLPREMASPASDRLRASPVDSLSDMGELCPQANGAWMQRRADCSLARKNDRDNVSFSRTDTILIMFYLENLLPFLFPFYRPSLLEGGRAWILEMMISSPVLRQATLCQSSYFFSLARETANHNVVWETVLNQTREAFSVLRQSLQIIDSSGIADHLHGAVRIMSSIMQVLRFEVAVSSFGSCQAHLSAAVALFRQLLDTGAGEPFCPSSSFHAILSRLGPSSWFLSAQSIQVPSAEQAALRFSTALLILDDIIASTVLQEQPRLYEYHYSLLGNTTGAGAPVDLEVTVGCQNWVMLQISEISVLDAWKQQCKRVGNLDVMELVRRATNIKDTLENHLMRLDADPAMSPKEGNGMLDVFTAEHYLQSKTPTSQTSLVTRIWAHAAHIYLFVVVSGWQPASVDVRYHVGRIVELLTYQISPPALLRTMVWPFCVAGCLAEPAQEAHLRGMVEALQPPSVFGTCRTALEIMENVWRNRDTGDVASLDLATCFRSQGDLVLLV